MQNKCGKKQAFYMPKNVHKITHLQNFHTYIQILQNANWLLDIVLPRKEQKKFLFRFFFFFPNAIVLSQPHKRVKRK